jgi:protein phosphatase
MRISFHCASHAGNVRKNNEDSLLVLPDENLLVVADGLGGQNCGEVASRVAVHRIRDFFRTTGAESAITWPSIDTRVQDDLGRRLVSAVQYAHAGVRDAAVETPQFSGMSTTVVAAWFVQRRVYVAHVGDSRCYRMTGGRLVQITRDHTLVNELENLGQGAPAEGVTLQALRHVLSRAVGTGSAPHVQTDLAVVSPEVGDVFLLCSDGMTLDTPDDRIAQVLSSGDPPDDMVQELLALALAASGGDNITVVVARVESLEEDDGGNGCADPDTAETTVEVAE